MGSSGVLEGFCAGVQKFLSEKAKAFDWTALITALLPVVAQIIQSCFNTSKQLAAFAGGQRSALQMAGLRLRCRQVVQEMGVSGPFRIASAASSLQAAILARLDEQAGAAEGDDVWQAALDEAHTVAA